MNLQLAVLTSFCANGLRRLVDANGEWPITTSNNIELYALMQPDAGWIFQTSENISALEAMAAGSVSPETAASMLASLFREKNIVAVSTFLPEITGEDGRLAEQALIYVVRMIHALRETYKHTVRTLELVAGSAIAGVYISVDRIVGNQADRTFSLKTLGEVEAIELLLKRTRKLADVADTLGVNIAIELEPGPLFTIKNISSLRNFCILLDAKGTRAQKNRFGLNLDIPHWAFLAGIDLEDLKHNRDNAMILERIVHNHVSDHSKGHYCDKAPIEGGPREAEFRRWIAFAQTLATAPKAGSLKASGYLSVELECCNALQDVEHSLRYYAKRLAELAGGHLTTAAA